MSGFVYKWTNQINNKWYIGSHKGTTDDGYRHSSQVMLAAEQKYGKHSFVREILYEGHDYRSVEGGLLTSLDAVNDKMSYNRRNLIGPSSLSENHRKKISEKMKGNKNGRGHKGIPKTEIQKSHQSAAMKGRAPWNKNKPGYTLPAASAQRKCKISDSKIGKPRSESEKTRIRMMNEQRRKGVTINGIDYPSRREAGKAFGVTGEAICRWIKLGKAVSV